MNNIILYCGEWKHLPQEIKNGIYIICQTYETGKEMSDMGRDIFVDDLEDGIDRRYFSNNENVFYGIRLAVKEKGLKAAERFSFIFYDHNGNAHRIKLDPDGNITGQYIPGFFDQTCNDLTNLF